MVKAAQPQRLLLCGHCRLLIAKQCTTHLAQSTCATRHPITTIVITICHWNHYPASINTTISTFPHHRSVPLTNFNYNLIAVHIVYLLYISLIQIPPGKLELSQKTSSDNNDQNLSKKSNVHPEEDNIDDRSALSAHLLPFITSIDDPICHTFSAGENNSLSSKDCTRQDKTTAYSKSSTYADVNRPSPPPVGATLDYNSEVELISLIEEKIPKYKLRIDTITEFTGYQHNDWLIETPLIDLNAPIELNPTILRETLNYFILSGERLSQMTRVYNDTDALTRLLEEKERDLELAARIGQSLLDQNQGQNERINELENELSQAKDKIVQLKHEISSKKDLLQIYLKDEEDEEEEYFSSLNEDSLSSRSPNKTTQLLTELEKRVGTLETENHKLKSETISRTSELESEERKELQLIDECARQLSSTNKQVALLQEDITRKNEENSRLQSEISTLTSQVASLEKRIRKLTTENDELESALSLAHECQSELSIELIDVKEKQANLLIAFHEKQEECRQLAKRNSLTDQFFPYADSLAYELEQFSLNGAISHLDICDTSFPVLDATYHPHQCPTPDSLLSNDSFYTSSPFTSFSGQSTSLHNDLNKSPSSLSSGIITGASSTPPTVTTTTSASRTIHRHHFMTDKLRYIKPIEGSQILNHWRKLASPNLNNLFEDKEKYISRIKANLAASEVTISASSNKRPTIIGSSSTSVAMRTAQSSPGTRVANNFVTTNSVFTFTTTSLSQTKESVTHVTSTFSSVQPSTGKSDFSLDLHSIQSQKQHDSLQDIRNSAHMCTLTAQSTETQARTESSSTRATGANVGRTLTDSNRATRKPSSAEASNASSSQLKLEPLSGLNELSKLLEKDSMGLFSSALRPLNPNRRIMTKVMANANDLVGLTKVATSDFFRTDLSVLRNLRKGGLI